MYQLILKGLFSFNMKYRLYLLHKCPCVTLVLCYWLLVAAIYKRLHMDLRFIDSGTSE